MGRGFGRFWAASATNSFGMAITMVALPVLVVDVLGATPIEVGIVNAAQFVPYAVLGLIVGVFVDRWRRKPVLVWASAGRGVMLGLIPVLWSLGVLEIWVLVTALLVYGALSVFALAASQSLLPGLVPKSRLLRANARIDQTDAAAQTAGPALGGGLIALVGAPFALAIDAVTYLVQAALVAGIRLAEPVRARTTEQRLWRDIREGLAWLYRHRTLAPLAWSTHVWFLANAAALTVLALFALRTLEVTPFVYGVLFSAAGVAMLLGASVASWCGRRFGSGLVVVVARGMYPLAWLLIALAPISSDEGSRTTALVLLVVALTLQGFAAGVENSNEMSLWQALTPDALLGRVNATRRSVNRSIGALGALLGGVTATVVDERGALLAVTSVFAVAALIALLSPVRRARHDEDDGTADAE